MIRAKVIAWRNPYQPQGLAGLEDEPRSGRPWEIDGARVIATTLAPPPAEYAVTHWSSRLLARHLPHLEAEVVDVVGLYLDPPENAVVLCADEKSQIRALDRTAPVLPMQPHLIERRSHDYIRQLDQHATTTLFAALEIATGKMTSRCQGRHRHEGFLVFLCQIARAYPAVEPQL
jgi:hypothetical protein